MIRKYRSEDLDELISVWEAASAIAHPFLSPEFIATERENIAKLYLPMTETWVAEQGGHVVGFIALFGDVVGALFVDPNYHRKGLGGTLMDKACETQDELHLDVFEANQIGRRFYTKYGFEFVERKLHEPTGMNVLRLHLPPRQ